MTSSIGLLFLLDPVDALNVDASREKLNQILVMTDKRWQVHLVSSRLAHYDNLTFDCIVHKVPLMRSPDSIVWRTIYVFLLIAKAVTIVKKHDVHAIMCKGGHLPLGLAAYVASRMTARKCIIRVNEDAVLDIILFIKRLGIPLLGNDIFLRMIENACRKLEGFLFKHVDWIVTQGPMDYERIRKLTASVTFIPLWVDGDSFCPIENRQIHRLREETLGFKNNKAILFVGRLQSDKEVETLIYAFKRLLGLRNDVELVLVGTGPEKETYRRMVKELGLGGRVNFLGYIRHSEMPKYYNIADVYVLTSLWEEWSNTIMEAMACGIPVIATNVGGNPYLVKDAETGFLVPVKNAQILAERIDYVLNHPVQAKNITSNARLNVEKFSKQAIGNSYKAVIKSAIDGK